MPERRALGLQEKQSFADSKRNYTQNAINTIYHNDLDITHIDSWRIILDKKRDRHDNMPLQQKQYLTHDAPMIIERWALPIFKKAGYTPNNTRPISQSASQCACCEVCFLYCGLEPGITEPHNMYICDCNRINHCACLNNTGGYCTERQREEVDKTISGPAQRVLT